MKDTIINIWLILTMPLVAGLMAPDGWHIAVGLTVAMLSLLFMKLCVLNELLEKQNASNMNQQK